MASIDKVNVGGTSYDVHDARVGSSLYIGRKIFSVDKALNSTTRITADDVDGYHFVCWLTFSTSGWVGAIYAQSAADKTTNVWVSASSQTGTGDVTAFVLYEVN